MTTLGFLIAAASQASAQAAAALRERKRALRVALHRLLGHRGLDDRAPAVRGRLGSARRRRSK